MRGTPVFMRFLAQFSKLRSSRDPRDGVKTGASSAPPTIRILAQGYRLIDAKPGPAIIASDNHRDENASMPFRIAAAIPLCWHSQQTSLRRPTVLYSYCKPTK